MTLAIGVCCHDGVVAIADTRTTRREGNIRCFVDGYEKIVNIGGTILYNHGYNWIGGKDWKHRTSDIQKDIWHPLYEELRDELSAKDDKELKSSYVFLDRNGFVENTVRHWEIQCRRLPNEWWLTSGTGSTFITSEELNVLRGKSVEEVFDRLPDLMALAYSKVRDQKDSCFNDQWTMHGIIHESGQSLAATSNG